MSKDSVAESLAESLRRPPTNREVLAEVRRELLNLARQLRARPSPVVAGSASERLDALAAQLDADLIETA